MAIYCGVDFHARQQTVGYCDTADGVVRLAELDHQVDDLRGFYSSMVGEVVVVIEASGYSTWCVELVEGRGHRVLVGDASEVRRLAKRRQKNDRRDASHLLDLLRGEFPQVHRPPFESREVLRLLRHRHKLVQFRTRARNGLQALARERRLLWEVAALEPGGARAVPPAGDERGDEPTAGGMALAGGRPQPAHQEPGQMARRAGAV